MYLKLLWNFKLKRSKKQSAIIKIVDILSYVANALLRSHKHKWVCGTRSFWQQSYPKIDASWYNIGGGSRDVNNQFHWSIDRLIGIVVKFFNFYSRSAKRNHLIDMQDCNFKCTEFWIKLHSNSMCKKNKWKIQLTRY